MSETDKKACQREVSNLLSKYGGSVLLHSLADVLDANARVLATTGIHAELVEEMDTLTSALRKGADGQL